VARSCRTAIARQQQIGLYRRRIGGRQALDDGRVGPADYRRTVPVDDDGNARIARGSRERDLDTRYRRE
jgi:hypothetical protein